MDPNGEVAARVTPAVPRRLRDGVEGNGATPAWFPLPGDRIMAHGSETPVTGIGLSGALSRHLVRLDPKPTNPCDFRLYY